MNNKDHATSRPSCPCGIVTRGRVLTLTVGLPASGKTAFAMTAGFDRPVSLDDCRKALWGDMKIQDGPGGIDALLAMQKEMLICAMRKNKSIIVHNTSILKEHRTQLIELAKNNGYRTQILYFDTPAEECIRRNGLREDGVGEDIIKNFAGKMEVPACDEADVVVKYSELRKSG